MRGKAVEQRRDSSSKFSHQFCGHVSSPFTPGEGSLKDAQPQTEIEGVDSKPPSPPTPAGWGRFRVTFLAELAKLGLESETCNFAKFQLAPRAGPGKCESMLGIPKMCPVWGLCLPFPRPSGSHRQGLGPPTICGQRKKNSVPLPQVGLMLQTC